MSLNSNTETPESVWASIVDGLEKKEDRDKYPDSVFWFKNGSCYFEYDEKEKYFWCRYHLVWLAFEKLILDYSKIRAFIEERVAEHFNLKYVTAVEGDYYPMTIAQRNPESETVRVGLLTTVTTVRLMEKHFDGLDLK